MRMTLPEWAKEGTIWLDDDNAIRFVIQDNETTPYGASWFHRDKREPNHVCVGGFQWRRPNATASGAIWTLESLEPLTIAPSLLCMTCGAHGFIRDGKWVPA
jgi:hypothetical protein